MAFLKTIGRPLGFCLSQRGPALPTDEADEVGAREWPAFHVEFQTLTTFLTLGKDIGHEGARHLLRSKLAATVEQRVYRGHGIVSPAYRAGISSLDLLLFDELVRPRFRALEESLMPSTAEFSTPSISCSMAVSFSW